MFVMPRKESPDVAVMSAHSVYIDNLHPPFLEVTIPNYAERCRSIVYLVGMSAGTMQGLPVAANFVTFRHRTMNHGVSGKYQLFAS